MYEESQENISTLDDSFQREKIDNSLLHNISSILEKIITQNESLPHYKSIIKSQSATVFSATAPPKISLFDYLYRIKSYGEMEDSTLVLSLILIDRFCEMNNVFLTQYNIHRILFASVLISVKYNEDLFYDNSFYAELGGVSLKELNSIENSFIDMLNFKLYVESTIYEKYVKYFESLNQIK